MILPTSPFFLRARIASAVGRKTISRQFFWSLSSLPAPRLATISDVPGRGDGKRRPEIVGREKGGPPVRRPLRSGRAIKVFAHEGVEAEEPGERRACKKEKSRGRRKGKIMPAFARRTHRWMSRGSMIDRCDWGPLKLAISRTSC